MSVRSTWRGVVRSPLGITALVLVSLVALTALFAPAIWGAQAERVDPTAITQGPSAAHLLGTDTLGRDVLARVLVATQLSVALAVAAVIIGVVVGALLGTAPSVLPRWAGRPITTLVNIAVAFPGLLLALFFAVIFGVGTTGSVLAIGLALAPGFARLTQTLSAAIAGRDFIAASRVVGASRLRILFRHILPNIGEPLIVNATVAAGSTLLAFAGLSFLGLGVQVPAYDWGRLLGEGLNRIYLNPAAALGPATAVVVAGLAFNLLGETAAAALGGRSARPQRRPRTTDSPASPLAQVGGDDVVLLVDDLRVSLPTPSGWVTPVRGVGFTISRGEAIGVVGESGSGKSLTALAAAKLIEAPGVVTARQLEFCGTPLLTTPDRALRGLLGTSLAMVFQDPMTSFNPTRRIGSQLAEAASEHQAISRRDAAVRAVDRLRAVRVPAAERRAHQYPHEFSGGMRQRAMIAMGLMNHPRLIIADEPTTALDVTVQRQVLQLLAAVRRDTDAAILLISHDIAVVAQTCDRVLVMYAGRIVEDLPAAELHTAARHPYTRALLDVIPDLDTDRTTALKTIPGRPPAPSAFPPGCAFADRCPLASAVCRERDPELVSDDRGRRVACWHPVTGDGPAAALPVITTALPVTDQEGAVR
ncbi:dipeptide/oligopeptide/nickel ABC transporter permease/ATP-binding protein [Microbacterium sp. p3-SID336]|uniref:dipeptide/oligopeptide/nickel ABC transporter permease/ATP-binding protein n=1 Tax=Microbacterium sp. p3-SID336 TaxID=2916212 RepID=UPI0021A7233B|nr:dipeptide/oligopeptide/nickel ABC transporter permease/ATP-binding protein [Microbacterium sp. p3-SID336]MCT1479238.1 dipeptide/oligopeptide/nickel ABC transporter permease/ATP-binding protein [Microbacterium sp. p3-SID336]